MTTNDMGEEGSDRLISGDDVICERSLKPHFLQRSAAFRETVSITFLRNDTIKTLTKLPKDVPECGEDFTSTSCGTCAKVQPHLSHFMVSYL